MKSKRAIPVQVQPVVRHILTKKCNSQAKIICICGQETFMNMIGNKNADGKSICECGRHITLHLRSV